MDQGCGAGAPADGATVAMVATVAMAAKPAAASRPVKPAGHAKPAGPAEPGHAAPRVAAPLVSVIVSNYNYARYLAASVASVHAQVYAPIECIVVDDCSTDGSDAVLAALERDGSGTRVVRCEANGGQSRAVLRGLQEAGGEFVVFLDADDILFPEFVARHVALLLSSRRMVGFSCCNAAQMDADGRLLGRWGNISAAFLAMPADPELLSPSCIEALRGQGLALRAVAPADVRHVPWSNMAWPWTSTSSMCFRRSAVELVRGAAGLPGLRIGTDSFLAFLINHLAGSLLLDETLAGYRLHGSNNFNRRASLDNFLCHARADEHHLPVRRAMLDDLLLRFEHYAADMEDPARIFDICRLLDGPDPEAGLPRWAARSRFRRLLVERGRGWRHLVPRKRMWDLMVERRLPLPPLSAAPRLLAC